MLVRHQIQASSLGGSTCICRCRPCGSHLRQFPYEARTLIVDAFVCCDGSAIGARCRKSQEFSRIQASSFGCKEIAIIFLGALAQSRFALSIVPETAESGRHLPCLLLKVMVAAIWQHAAGAIAMRFLSKSMAMGRELVYTKTGCRSLRFAQNLFSTPPPKRDDKRRDNDGERETTYRTNIMGKSIRSKIKRKHRAEFRKTIGTVRICFRLALAHASHAQRLTTVSTCFQEAFLKTQKIVQERLESNIEKQSLKSLEKLSSALSTDATATSSAVAEQIMLADNGDSAASSSSSLRGENKVIVNKRSRKKQKHSYHMKGMVGTKDAAGKEQGTAMLVDKPRPRFFCKF